MTLLSLKVYFQHHVDRHEAVSSSRNLVVEILLCIIFQHEGNGNRPSTWWDTCHVTKVVKYPQLRIQGVFRTTVFLFIVEVEFCKARKVLYNVLRFGINSITWFCKDLCTRRGSTHGWFECLMCLQRGRVLFDGL